jgi:aldose 1-epimerase
MGESGMDRPRPGIDRKTLEGIDFTVLREPSTGSEAWIAGGIGANCPRFVTEVAGKELEVIHLPDSLSSFRERPTYFGSAVLFPFPGRIRGGKFRFDNADIQVPINEPATGNAIHGCVAKQPWAELAASADDRGAEATFAIGTERIPAMLDDFPFPFRLTMRARLSGGTLTFSFVAENSGQRPMPVGLGVHPYFPLPLGGTGSVDDCEIRVDAPYFWEQKDYMPVGRSLPVESSIDLRTPRSLRALASVGYGGPDRMVNFAHSQFSDERGPLPSGSGIRWGVRNPKANRQVVVEGDAGFPASVTYIPPTREKVSFEPHSCLPNAFNLATEGKVAGQMTLGPGEFWRASFSIRAGEIT